VIRYAAPVDYRPRRNQKVAHGIGQWRPFLDQTGTDTARLDLLYWTQVNTPADTLMYIENGDLERLNHTK